MVNFMCVREREDVGVRGVRMVARARRVQLPAVPLKQVCGTRVARLAMRAVSAWSLSRTLRATAHAAGGRARRIVTSQRLACVCGCGSLLTKNLAEGAM